MIDIIPAILVNQIEALQRQLHEAASFAPLVHIDITNGTFTPTVSITPQDIVAAKPVIPFEVHLMVDRPEDIVPDVLVANPLRVIFHRHALEEDAHKLCALLHRHNCEAAIAVSPSSLDLNLEPLLRSVDQVTFVSVDPGFQGGSLIPGVLQKAQSFCALHRQVLVEIDGGIKEYTLHEAVQTGAQRIVVGSGIWESDQPALAYSRLVDRVMQLTKEA